jgi:hypothetical protein
MSPALDETDLTQERVAEIEADRSLVEAPCEGRLRYEGMDERSRRIGQNEGVFRAVNEEIESLNRGLAAISDRKLHIVCECGHLSCAEPLSVGIDEYERIRAKSALFFVVPGHDLPSVERIVERHGTYDVVRKDDGGPARLAEATDPRS